jgi:hypothetical protein
MFFRFTTLCGREFVVSDNNFYIERIIGENKFYVTIIEADSSGYSIDEKTYDQISSVLLRNPIFLPREFNHP